MLDKIGHVLLMLFTMAWEILWALILGFLLSAVVQAVVSKEKMSRLLPDDKPGTILKACGLGAASSSYSYAAVALARSMFKKGQSVSHIAISSGYESESSFGVAFKKVMGLSPRQYCRTRSAASLEFHQAVRTFTVWLSSVIEKLFWSLAPSVNEAK